MIDHDIRALMQAAAERQLAVTELQIKYAENHNFSTEQLVLDMRQLLATERVVLDAIITLFIDVSHGDAAGETQNPLPTASPSALC